MDHHGGMQHGGHGDYAATCIVSPALRVHNITTLIFYMLVLFATGIFYEWWRLQPARLEAKLRSSDAFKQGKPRHVGNDDGRSRSPLLGERVSTPGLYPAGRFTTSQKLLRSGLYTSIVAMSFFLMLVIMTYNTYLITAVLAGAFVGHFMFHDDPIIEFDRGMACH